MQGGSGQGGWNPSGGPGAPAGQGLPPMPPTPDAPPAAPIGAAPLSARSGYEFNDAQNRRLATLAQRLVVAGILQMLFGGLQLIGGWMVGSGSWFVGLPGSIALLAIGALIFAAGRSFQEIVDTQGNDIEHLMRALGRLSLAALVIIIGYVAAIVLGIVIAVLTGTP